MSIDKILLKYLQFMYIAYLVIVTPQMYSRIYSDFFSEMKKKAQTPSDSWNYMYCVIHIQILLHESCTGQ